MADMDRSAAEILHFQPSVIPGLLQSESYARRVLTFGDVSGRGGIDAAVKARMTRQSILREPGRRFDYVLTEGALRWRPGPKAMMEEQFGRLLAAAALPGVTLSIIPFDREARAVYSHGFAVFRIPEVPSYSLRATPKKISSLTRDDVDAYERIFSLLRESALTGTEAAGVRPHGDARPNSP